MKRNWLFCILTALIAIILVLPVEAQSAIRPSMEWQRFLPGLSGNFVMQTSDGGYLAIGETSSYDYQNDWWSTPTSVVAKTDSGGNLVWSETYTLQDGLRTFISNAIEVNGGYILGGVVDADMNHVSAHLCLIKIDYDGKIVWTTESQFQRSNTYTQVTAITTTSDDGALLVGTASYAPPSAPFIVLTKVDDNGKIEFDGPIPEDITPIFPYYSGMVSSVLQTSDGGFIILNNQGQSHPISPSSFSIVKLDQKFDLIWSKSYGGSGDTYHTTGGQIIAVSDGYLVSASVAPASEGSSGLLLKTDFSGNMQWNKTYQSLSNVYGLMNYSSGFLMIGVQCDSLTSTSEKDLQVRVWQTDSYGNIVNGTDLMKVDYYTFGGPKSLNPTSDGGAVFTGKNLYGSYGKGQGEYPSVEKFWIAKISFKNSSDAPELSPLAPVIVVGVAFAVTLAVIVLVKFKLAKSASYSTVNQSLEMYKRKFFF